MAASALDLESLTHPSSAPTPNLTWPFLLWLIYKVRMNTYIHDHQDIQDLYKITLLILSYWLVMIRYSMTDSPIRKLQSSNSFDAFLILQRYKA